MAFGTDFSLLQPLQLQLIKSHQYLVTAANTMAQHAAVEALTAGKNDAEPMKKEYIQRRDYIIEKMTALGFEDYQNQTVPSISLLRFQRVTIKTSFAFLKDFAQRRLLPLSLVLPLGVMEKVMFACLMRLAWRLIEEAMKRLEEYMRES